MSYCRFSSDDYKCDVYCYGTTEGEFVIHVASRRVVLDKPLPPEVDVEEDAIGYFRRFVEVTKAVRRAQEKGKMADIGLPCDGQTFREAGATAAATRLGELKAMGYNVPQYAIDELLEEAQTKEV